VISGVTDLTDTVTPMPSWADQVRQVVQDLGAPHRWSSPQPQLFTLVEGLLAIIEGDGKCCSEPLKSLEQVHSEPGQLRVRVAVLNVFRCVVMVEGHGVECDADVEVPTVTRMPPAIVVTSSVPSWCTRRRQSRRLSGLGHVHLDRQ